MDPITGANQNTETYWRRIKTAFDERMLVGLEFAGIHMECGDKAMSNHWASIQQACNKWHVIQEEVMSRPESGANVEPQMVRMFEMFRRDSNTDADFKFLHVFTRIESCEKWAEARLALAKAKDDVHNPDAPISWAAKGWPDGNKKAKKARDSAPAFERLQALIEECIADTKSHSAMREEKSEARWSALMTKQGAKLDLLRTNVAAKKRNTNLAFLMGGGDTATMDPQVKAWYLAEQNLILNLMPGLAATASTPITTTLPTPTVAAPTTITATPPRTPTSPVLEYYIYSHVTFRTYPIV
ncbi:uncharacterized protein LOC123443598 [Hordeum vulgare subsp. vulgare]|uniref:uncharacterized protein LOC123443598 n=1 Tax=Hordeum vulgare subsp. vulgare TaxID=112509 RepID=UPI001D1A5464|nr:uncharacterized protein LOC123443598 [Hordeum vulgare subsp. vulgare]